MTPLLATIDPWILTFSAITVIVTIWMGFRSAKTSKTASDFFVAGRSVSVGWNASAISGEYLSAASFMGVAGMVMSSGYDALWYPVCYACGYLFLLLFIAGPLRRFGAYTIPDFAEGRYDSPVFRKIAVIFVLFIGFFYTMPQMKGAGTTLAYIFPGMPYWGGVVLVGAVITLNVALGGMKGITLVQAFQYWAKMFAISVPIFVLMSVYGHYGKQLEVNGNTQPTVRSEPHALQDSLLEKARELYVVGESAKTTNNPSLKDIAEKMALKSGLVGFGFPAMPPITVENVADLYASLSTGSTAVNSTGYTTCVAPGLETIMISIAGVQSVNLKGLLAHFRSTLATNGFTLVEDKPGFVRVFPTAEAEKYNSPFLQAESSSAFRKPLPEKAPKDETWISPFGPLTTKAVKAAEARRKATTVSEEFGEMDYDITAAAGGATNTTAMLAAKGKDILERHVTDPELHTGSPDLGELLIELRKTRKVPVLAAASVATNITHWITNRIDVPGTDNANRTNIILSGFATANLGLIYAREATLLVPLSKAKDYEEIYNRAGIAPFKEGPPNPEQIKVRERRMALLYTYSLIIALVCGTAGLPHILVRFYTNPDGVAAKRTTMWVMILIGVFYVFPPVFGVIGRNLMPELYTGLSGIKGTDQVVLKLPTLLTEKYGVLGSILSGITCAGAFAAFMSTFSGLLVSMTGAMAHDVYGRMLRPKSTPEERLKAFKVAAVLIGGIAVILGCFVEPLEINFMVGQAFAIAAASYFPLLFMSVWWRGMTMKGAAIGMLTGGVCALVAAALTNFSTLSLDKGPMGKVFAVFAPLNDFWAAHPLLRILCEQPAIWTVPLAITLMIVVSKLAQKDVPPDIRMKMLVLHAPEKLGLKQEYIQEHQDTPGH